ncbi:fimbrial biogenesis chaperone [Citrobacter portucalensis]|uniref:Fimbria/pilus periplasmic chaperone n=1 Tax=Citrobacter portucalensis TaxID=1639133 RepID=A0A9X4GNH6_9ENTR|nr:fimbria/pilus periplasmic chaperone [Citrobacter portucalensis]MDE9619339.1 fimbria/pilus periplasmic chaperone [Citrobacter portucalensis]
MRVLRFVILPLFVAAMGMTAAQAGVSIGGTRVIYDGGKKEASLSVNNPDAIPYLIQTWIETPSNDTGKLPFIITPPLYRLDKGQQNVMRIICTGNLLENKESLFWLNIKSIPSAERKDNTLQIAIKTRIKLIYRPAGLNQSTPEAQADKLHWKLAGKIIQVTNPSPYFINFNEITVAGKRLEDVTFVAPASTASFVLPPGITGGAITYRIINDYGGIGEAHHSSP